MIDALPGTLIWPTLLCRVCREDQAVDCRQTDNIGITCPSWLVSVVSVLCIVLETLTQRAMPLVLEELRPPSRWANK